MLDKKPINPRSPFNWVLMDIIPSTAPKLLTSETTFSNYHLTVGAQSKDPKLYGMDRITTEEVMDKLDMFQYIFRKIHKFGWWDFEIISANAGTKCTSVMFKDKCQTCCVNLTLETLEQQKMNGQF